MEWTVPEQVYFFWQSICLGMGIGIVLDFLSGWGRGRSRRYRIWLDVLFGPVSAVMLFFGSLVIMNGQLHPLLFFGVLIGAVLEHLTVGRYLSRVITFARKILQKAKKALGNKSGDLAASLRSKVAVLIGRDNKLRKMKKKEAK